MAAVVRGEEKGDAGEAMTASGSTTTCVFAGPAQRRRMQAALGESAVGTLQGAALRFCVCFRGMDERAARAPSGWVPANVSPLLRDKQRLSAVSTSVAEGGGEGEDEVEVEEGEMEWPSKKNG